MKKMNCKIHENIKIRKSVKEYCPECEGYFSAHGFNLINRCPFAFKTKREEEIEIGRAHPLLKGSISHFVAQVFNKSLSYIPKNKFENTLKRTFNEFDSFLEYMKLMISDTILNSVINIVKSIYLYKKDLFESLYSEDAIFNMIPLVTEEWLFIPFDRKQFEEARRNGVSKWNKIGIHNILDDVVLDFDGQAICTDYKSYPRKQEKEILEIKNKYKKYQLITALLTFEYNYGIDVKFVSNVDLGTNDFPNITYHKPTSRGITYYKKALLQAYIDLIDENFYTKYNEFYCTKFCDVNLLCTDENLNQWKKSHILSTI